MTTTYQPNPVASDDAWTRLQAVADRYPCCTRADYLERARAGFERWLEFFEGAQRKEFEDAGASADLMHEYTLFVAGAQDLLAALAAEIREARGEPL